ncbi:hypothetical protein N431DRAFT_441607 [Stipitochalara longipes BDJ]|nr:hypothetical protein N431DRAFT_441607 [Stipitochalara longipes BDJ]
MDLTAKIEERDPNFGKWSRTPYNIPHSKKPKKSSVHRPQLDPRKEKIIHLSVQNPDGSIIDINEPDGRLKFAFTGGNDDPSIELHLMQFGPYPHAEPCPSTIIYKFAAFPASGRDIVYHGRQIHEFWPPRRLDQLEDVIIEDKHRGRTSFTDSLYDLRWEPFVEEDIAYVKISWKSKSMITFGLSLAPQASLEYANIARMFSSIAEHSVKQPDRVQEFTVKLRDVPDLQYRYRFLLAAYVRLLILFGSSSRVLSERSTPLRRTRRFKLREQYLNIPWQVKFQKLEKLGDASEKTFWVAILTSASTRSTRSEKIGADILPKQGSPVTVQWKRRTLGVTIHTHQASGLYLGAEIGMNKRASITVLVWSMNSYTDPLAFLTSKYEVLFDFSLQPKNLEFLLNSIDNILFFDAPSQGNKASVARIFEVLMARDNYKPMYDALPSPDYNPMISRMVKSMDSSQQEAMTRLASKIVSIMDGPHGSGKTTLAALFGALSIQAGEKVAFLTSTKAGVKELFLKVGEFAKELKFPPALIERFRCKEYQDWAPCDGLVLSNSFSKILPNDQYNIHRVKELQPQMSASQIGVAPTAVFGLYDELDRLDCQSFGATLLICDEAERAHDHSIFAACGLFVSTLKKVAFFGNSDKAHLHWYRSGSSEQAVCYGSRDLGIAMGYMYWDKARERSKIRVLDGVSTNDFQTRIFIQHWVAKYLRKDIEEAKVSVFANVLDGICLQDLAGHAEVNHQNMVAILHIIRSMVDAKLVPEKIIVITFFPEAAVAMRKFFKSQDIANIRIEHLDSDNIKLQKNLISIIDCPTTGHPGPRPRTQYDGQDRPLPGSGESLRILFRVQRLVSALCISQGLRVFVGNNSLLGASYEYEWQKSPGYALIKDLMDSHDRDAQTKDIQIGDELLEYEEVLRPGDYVFASDMSKSANQMYRNLKSIRGDDTESSPSSEPGEPRGIPWRSRTVAEAAAGTTNMSARNMNEVGRGSSRNRVEDDGIGDLQRGQKLRPDVGDAPASNLIPGARVERIWNKNWRTRS